MNVDQACREAFSSRDMGLTIFCLEPTERSFTSIAGTVAGPVACATDCDVTAGYIRRPGPKQDPYTTTYLAHPRRSASGVTKLGEGR